ncbi:MAG: hypothetical protein WCQ16_02310 [Verrucomicrobiae bacterium]
MEKATAEASPAKTLLEEIEVFRAAGHGTLDAIGANFDAQLDGIKSLVLNLGPVDGLPSKKLRDIRDMLTLLYSADVKPEKGRRKDLKKMTSILADLTMMVERWS